MSISLKRDWPTFAVILAAAILVIPLWCVRSPGMPDYPAHLAGFYLIGGAAAAKPLSEFYAINWILTPNLASELLVPALASLMPLETATKLFLTIAAVMWVLGPAMIQRALFGKIGPAALAGALFAYNANFTWGFFNYYFGAGLAFLVFAAWIARRGKLTASTLAAFAVAVTAVFFSHLFATCLLFALIACFELGAALHERAFEPKALALRALSVAAAFLPAALAFLFFKAPAGSDGAVEFNYADTIGDRFGSTIQWYYSEPAYLLIGGLAILILAGLFYGRIRVHTAMKFVVIVLAVLTLVAPEWALGGWGVNLRLPAVLGAVTFAALDFRIRPRPAMVFSAAALAVAGGAATALTGDWLARDAQYREFRTAIKDIPEGAKIMVVLDGEALDDMPDQPYWHMAEFAIVDRGAFTPLMFTTKGQHVVQLKPPYDKLAAATAQQGSPPDVGELPDLSLGRVADDPDIEEVFPYLKYFQCHFNEVVVVHGGGEQADVPDFLSLRHAGSFFALYDVHRTRICSGR